MKNLIEALTIFSKYSDDEYPTHCEHDVLMVNCVEKAKVSKEDKKRLKELGFFWSNEYEAFISFEFGSN